MDKTASGSRRAEGWLIVNRYLNSPSFTYITDRLLQAAERNNIWLHKHYNTDFTTPESVAAAGSPDFVLFWDKDIKLARLLESLGLRLFNPAGAIEDCDDKALTYLKLLGSGVKMPKTIMLPKIFVRVDWHECGFIESAADELGFPLIVKECFGSFGDQVYLAHSIPELYDIVDKIGTSPAILQECISSSLGRDMRLYVVGQNVSSAMCRYSECGDFRANITRGGHMKPHVPSPEQTSMALDVCRILGLDFAGVDLLFGEDDKPVLCEVNSNAHFKNLSDFTGVDIADLIIKHIIATICG